MLVMMPDCGVLFLSERNEPISTTRMTEIVRKAVEAADIGKRGSCHMFRHTCATLMLEGGADIRFIQQQLGHADLKTTDVYTQVAITKLKEIHAATHPGAKLKRLKQEKPTPADSASTPPEIGHSTDKK